MSEKVIDSIGTINAIGSFKNKNLGEYSRKQLKNWRGCYFV